jgi:hypothetical protein
MSAISRGQLSRSGSPAIPSPRFTLVDAASLIGNHSRSIVVRGERKGDLAAVGMSRKHEGKAESLRLLKETWPMRQQDTRMVTRDFPRQAFEYGTLGIPFHPVDRLGVFESGHHQRSTVDVDPLPFITQQSNRRELRDPLGDFFRTRIVIVVSEHSIDAAARVELCEFTTADFYIVAAEVEEISRDDDQIRLEFIDLRNEACQPIGAEKRADMQVGDVDQLDVFELAWKVRQRK